MAEYHIRFLSSAAKEFRSLPLDVKRRIGKAVDALEQNPYIPVFASSMDTVSFIGLELANTVLSMKLMNR